MTAPTIRTPPLAIPPLQHGDQLSRDEFERRYEAMPHVKKAELLEGVVYMPSPVSYTHGSPHAKIITWLGVYEANTPALGIGDNSTVRLDLNNEPQPDALLFILPTHGGQAVIDDDDYISGSPELVAEVAVSSVPIDLGVKFRAYQRNGVREYLVWRVLDDAFDWFVLRGTQYERLTPDTSGIYESETFPGLRLDPAALLRFDLATVLQTLQQGIDSPAHAAFVTRLQQAERPTP